MALAGLAAVWVWWLVRTRDRRAARSKLKAACRRNDARGARDALLDWSRAVGRRRDPNLHIDAGGA